MANSDKKQKERAQLEQLRSLIADFPVGEVIGDEEPDFLIRGERTVGIELTELHRLPAAGQAPAQETQSLHERAIRRASDVYVAAGHPPVECNFQFREPVSKADVPRLAQVLADLVARIRPEMDEQCSEEFTWDNRDYFPEVLTYVSVRRYPAIEKTFFGAAGPAPAVPLRVEDVKRVVQAKEGKIPSYRQRCDEVWLVIVVDSEFTSTWFHGDDGSLDSPVGSRFSRILLLSRIGGTVRAMRVELPNAKSCA